MITVNPGKNTMGDTLVVPHTIPGNGGFMFKKQLPIAKALALIIFIGFIALPAMQAQEMPRVDQSIEAIRSEEYGAFINEEFGVAFRPIVGKEDFLAAIATSTGAAVGSLEPATTADGPFDSLAAVSIALKAANMKELAYSYPAEKVGKNLARAGFGSLGLGARSAQELAAAVDTGLIPPALYATFDPKAAPGADLANSLVGGVLSARGLYKHHIGFVREIDIYAKVSDAFRRSSIIKAPELRAIVDSALRQNLVTGYNLKDSRYDPHFIDALTLTYGHSDLAHAIQLLGLLKSEGIDAKVQLEPKTSAFVFMKEWGDPGPSNEDYEVVRIENGNYIEYAREYDISFEFRTVQDKERFQPLIYAYAKKNQKNQAGLLIQSWWQPLYHSMTTMDGYLVITNQLIAKGPYYAQSFSLNEQSAAIVQGFKSIDPSLAIKTYQFWVDEPFFRYLQGMAK